MESINVKHLLIKNTGFQAVNQAVSLGIGLVTTMVLSRYLGVERFGRFNYIFAFFYFFLSINDFGVNVIVVREASKNRERVGEIIGAMLSFKLLLAAFSIVAAWLAIWLMKFPPDLQNALFVYTLILPVMALQLPAVIFQVLLKMEYPSMIGIVNRVLSFLLLMIMVWFGYGLTALATALIVAETVSLILLLKYARAFVRPVYKLDPKLWKEVLRSSIPLGVMGLCVALINRVDFIMLERMTNLHQVGLYSAAYKVTNLLEAFPLMIMATIYPLMSRYAKEDPDKLRALYKQCVLYLGVVAVPMGIGITVFAPVIIRLLFGAQFAGADRGLMVLVWYVVFVYLAIAGGNLLISMGRERVNLYILAPSALVNVGLNLLWIPTMGFVGAALSTMITFLIILVGTTIAVRVYLSQKELEVGRVFPRCHVELIERKY
jgi:O-antigen/teichoic acid export membrane protein